MCFTEVYIYKMAAVLHPVGVCDVLFNVHQIVLYMQY